MAAAKPRNILWLRHCQKRPGCSRPALLSAALKAARMKHKQQLRGELNSLFTLLGIQVLPVLQGFKAFLAEKALGSQTDSS